MPEFQQSRYKYLRQSYLKLSVQPVSLYISYQLRQLPLSQDWFLQSGKAQLTQDLIGIIYIGIEECSVCLHLKLCWNTVTEFLDLQLKFQRIQSYLTHTSQPVRIYRNKR
jgi:hypothetical protein